MVELEPYMKERHRVEVWGAAVWRHQVPRQYQGVVLERDSVCPRDGPWTRVLLYLTLNSLPV